MGNPNNEAMRLMIRMFGGSVDIPVREVRPTSNVEQQLVFQLDDVDSSQVQQLQQVQSFENGVGHSNQWAMHSSHREQVLLLKVANDKLEKQKKELSMLLKEAQAFKEHATKMISVYEVIHKQDESIIKQNNRIIAANDEKIAALEREEVKTPNTAKKVSEKRMLRTLVKLAEKLKENDLLTIHYTKKLEGWTELLSDENNDSYDVDGLEESPGPKNTKEEPNAEAPAENFVTAVVEEAEMAEESAVPSDAPPSPAREENLETAEEPEPELPEATDEATSPVKENMNPVVVIEPLNMELTAAPALTAEENLIPNDVAVEAIVMNDSPVSLADPQSAEVEAPPAGGAENEAGEQAVAIRDGEQVLSHDTPETAVETLSTEESEEMQGVEMVEAQSKPVQAGDSATGCAGDDAMQKEGCQTQEAEECEESKPSTAEKDDDEIADGEDDWIHMELSDDDSVCDVSMKIDEETVGTEGEEQEMSVHQEEEKAPVFETPETADSQQAIPIVESQAEPENKNQAESAPPAGAIKVAVDLLQAKNHMVTAKIVEDEIEAEVSRLVSRNSNLAELASLWDSDKEMEKQKQTDSSMLSVTREVSLALEMPPGRTADAPPSTSQSSNAEEAAKEDEETEAEPEMVLPKKALKRKSSILKQEFTPEKPKTRVIFLGTWKYSPDKVDTPLEPIKSQLSTNCSRMKITAFVDDEAPDATARPRSKTTLLRNTSLPDY
ncbi:neurofilament heavy polypeptide-like [Cloeon dipterum]|uniref:neurofilament heavy polypeptide-like n=1 Tax=Cloeon dipterum TaxID=197152 RepID=UPI00322064CC